jgi:hypothetical protein
VDEFHRFRSEAPAGGPRVDLDTSALPVRQVCTPFPGGTWEVLSA